MKIQFGSALADETKGNAYITIPGLRGLPHKEISVKNLANIIQARMSEILDFVSYHLKQVGLDSRLLNGGLVLTGGGAQLKHLIQLSEYVTGLNARIGYPNEHLAAGHIDELAKPMYSTCIGLILKGYNVYENHANLLKPAFADDTDRGQAHEAVSVMEDAEGTGTLRVPKRKSLKGFMDSIKDGLIDLFKEEEDSRL
jgi:cell division protein FtsA